jgi:hypothetical protein
VTWWQWGLIEVVGSALGWAARAVACAAMAALCLVWTLAIGGIVGALKAGLIGLIDHYSFSHMVSAMVAGFFAGAAMSLVMGLLLRVGIKIVSAVGVRRLIQAGIVGLVSFITSRGSTALRRYAQMLSVVAVFIIGIVLQGLTLDLAKARVDENPARYEKQSSGFWGKLQRHQARYFNKELSASQLSRRLRVTWVVLGLVLLVTVPLDILLFGRESSLFAGTPLRS